MGLLPIAGNQRLHIVLCELTIRKSTTTVPLKLAKEDV